ncbi:uncharacterized protein DS421_12g357240 [Arachis hypogaea]|nr:uncharacterized protein DS421_12g357240 [Arachis hypogaea]
MTEKKRLDSNTASTTDERRATNGSGFDYVWCVLLRFVEDDDGCWFVEETAAGEVVCGAVEDEGQRGKDRTTTMVLSGDVDGGEEGGGPALRHSARETERELEELGFLVVEGWLRLDLEQLWWKATFILGFFNNTGSVRKQTPRNQCLPVNTEKARSARRKAIDGDDRGRDTGEHKEGKLGDDNHAVGAVGLRWPKLSLWDAVPAGCGGCADWGLRWLLWFVHFHRREERRWVYGSGSNMKGTRVSLQF